MLRMGFLAAGAWLLLAGDSDAGAPRDSIHADLILIGQVTSSKEAKFAPDISVSYAQYAFRLLNPPGTEVQLIGGGKCPLITAGDQVYLVLANKHTFQIEGNPDLLEVVACVPLDASNSTGFLNAK